VHLTNINWHHEEKYSQAPECGDMLHAVLALNARKGSDARTQLSVSIDLIKIIALITAQNSLFPCSRNDSSFLVALQPYRILSLLYIKSNLDCVISSLNFSLVDRALQFSWLLPSLYLAQMDLPVTETPAHIISIARYSWECVELLRY
jgi:hypothetical protein